MSPFLKGKLAPNLGGCHRHTSAKQKNPRKRNTQDLRKKGTNQGTQNKSQVDSDAISHESNQDKLGKTEKGQRAVGRCFFKKKVDFFHASNVIQDQEDLTGMIKAYHFLQKQKIGIYKKTKKIFIKNSKSKYKAN